MTRMLWWLMAALLLLLPLLPHAQSLENPPMDLQIKGGVERELEGEVIFSDYEIIEALGPGQGFDSPFAAPPEDYEVNVMFLLNPYFSGYVVLFDKEADEGLSTGTYPLTDDIVQTNLDRGAVVFALLDAKPGEEAGQFETPEKPSDGKLHLAEKEAEQMAGSIEALKMTSPENQEVTVEGDFNASYVPVENFGDYLDLLIGE